METDSSQEQMGHQKHPQLFLERKELQRYWKTCCQTLGLHCQTEMLQMQVCLWRQMLMKKELGLVLGMLAWLEKRLLQ